MFKQTVAEAAIVIYHRHMKTPYSADLFRNVGVVLLISMIVHCGCRADGSRSANLVGEKLVPLKDGESEVVSYGLFCGTSASRGASNKPPGSDLFLILRNNGAKWLDVDRVTVEDFNLRDSQGKNIKLYLRSHPQDMGYGDATVVHLEVDHAQDAVRPWTLHFKSKPETLVHFELTITGIEPGMK
jgi:hypothetical protein